MGEFGPQGLCGGRGVAGVCEGDISSRSSAHISGLQGERSPVAVVPTGGPAEGRGGAGPWGSKISAIAATVNKVPIPVLRELVLAKALVMVPERWGYALALPWQGEA